MADFTSVASISTNINAAGDILRIFKNIYGACVEVESILTRYQTDTPFQTEADHLYTTEQLGELGDMIASVITFRTEWFENHKGPLGFATPVEPIIPEP